MRSAVLASALLLVGVSQAPGEDWYLWRGPEMDGISRETGLLDDWSPDGKNVVWESRIGGRATPIVMNGRVYLNCRTADDVGDAKEKVHAREQVVCWDADTGDVLWKDVFNVFQTDIPAPRVGWAAMAGDPETGYAYVHSVGGIFRCYTPDGDVVWEHSLFEEYGKISGYGGRTQTPIIDEDRIIVSFLAANWGESKGPAPKHYYYAFDKRTGELLWVSAPGGRPNDTNYSVPIVAVIEGQRLLIGGNADGSVCAMQARTGKPVWTFRMSKRGLNTSVVVDGNYVYASHGEDNIDVVEFGRVQCIDARGEGDITETNSVWRVDDIKAGYASLLLKDGVLYVTTDTGKLVAFDSKTGEKFWDYSLGTVGKGSPVWADGKIYIMEVNGNVHILKASREGCESLSRVQLQSPVAAGLDEIYASPAIANGKVYFVTRDRTFCVADASKQWKDGKVPALPPEKPLGDEVAQLQVVPYESLLDAGESVDLEIRGFDANGAMLRTIEPGDCEVTIQGLPGAKLDGTTLETTNDGSHQAGTVTFGYKGIEAKARVRAFPPLPWEWSFDGYKGVDVPGTWVRAFAKLKPTDVDEDTALLYASDRGRPSHVVLMGPPNMKDYVVQADVRMEEERRRLPSVGLSNQRYNFFIKGNNIKLEIMSWPPHRRMAVEKSFRSDPDVWYTLKMRVDIEDGVAKVRGKAWKRGTEEPAEWTLEATDPHPNEIGPPGLYLYALAPAYFDNIKVFEKD